MDSVCLQVLIDFAYSGTLDLSLTQEIGIWPLLAACSDLQMMDALQLCHKHLEQGAKSLASQTGSSTLTPKSVSHTA